MCFYFRPPISNNLIPHLRSLCGLSLASLASLVWGLFNPIINNSIKRSIKKFINNTSLPLPLDLIDRERDGRMRGRGWMGEGRGKRRNGEVFVACRRLGNLFLSPPFFEMGWDGR
ncbi:hypothetical protein BKA65DRAFT_504330 [Rhexocercosporidium sp. MPI-PUGE-AT-0058]|nr:hypothetical protein BKA65DRAFT_504330 [Rhexocercosporidium sp. MPI-PUGE-AT-0058]